MTRAIVVRIAAGALIAFCGGLAVAQERRPDATLQLSQGSVAAGIGFSWGKGTLTYEGKTYPVKVQKPATKVASKILYSIALAFEGLLMEALTEQARLVAFA